MRWVLLLVLAMLGSCAAPQPYRISQSIPERASTLLRKLALDVPEDVAKLGAVSGGAVDARSIAAAPAFLDAAKSESDAARALDCLTSAIYYEARSESVDGQRAVAQVVLNRVRDRAFPKSVCGVVYQGSNRRTGCQFSFTCDGSMLRPRDQWSWARAGMVAAAALSGEVYAPVGSATHYHTTAILPWWAPSLTRLGTIGAHVFYRWPAAMERALAFKQSYDGYEPLVGAGSVSIAAMPQASGDFVNGVSIHRGNVAVAETSSDAAAPTTPPTPAASSAMRRVSYVSASGVRVHQGAEAPDKSFEAGPDAPGVRVHRGVDQLSRNPMPIEARAASASLETTG